MNDDPKEKKMKVIEYQHRNEGGGNSVQLPNEVFDHGELVVVLSKRELQIFLASLSKTLDQVMKTASLNVENVTNLVAVYNDVTDLQQGLRK
jgi:hypothetical protein